MPESIGIEDSESFKMNSTFLSDSKISCSPGKEIEKVLPYPSLLSTVIVPCSISTHSFTKESPIPLDKLASVCPKVSKRLNNISILCNSIPFPSSLTLMSRFFSLNSRIKSIFFPSGVYLKAFDSRLNNIFSSLSISV